ncbi:MAG: tRNA (guanine(10)-N(2))-dimethyltransferase [Candidatus Hadarchaeota archaeon]
MQTQLVAENTAKLEVPELSKFRTSAGDYAPSLTPVFYNPQMELCRDISVAVAQAASNLLGELSICDPLAGVGVRGIRYKKEVGGEPKVILNDHSPNAYALMLNNVRLNGLEGLVDVHQKDANVLLWENRGRFNFIDADPFGSPAPFIDSACAAMCKNGMIAITATDTAPLCGSGARACLRKYGAQPLRTEYCRETGIRILIGFAQRVAGKHELSLIPYLSHATQHYFRVYFWAEKRAKAADDVLKKQGYISHCFKCGRRFPTSGLAATLPESCECGAKLFHAGPLWLGQLSDEKFAEEVVKNLAKMSFRLGASEIFLVRRCADEAAGPPTFYEINQLAKLTKGKSPKISKIIEAIRMKGFFASRTHFSGGGLKTDAPITEITELFGAV